MSSILTLKIKNCIEDKKNEIDDRVYQVQTLKLFFPYIPTQQAIAHDTIVR
jgi:hypothetical protein